MSSRAAIRWLLLVPGFNQVGWTKGLGVARAKTEIQKVAKDIVHAQKRLEEVLAKGNSTMADFGEAVAREVAQRKDEFRRELLTIGTLTEEDGDMFSDLGNFLDKVLDQIGLVFVGAAVALQVDKLHAESVFGDIKGPLKHAFMVAAKTIERHPALFQLLVYFAGGPLPFGAWLMRPALDLLGFSAEGLVEGSFTASCRSRLRKDETEGRPAMNAKL